MAAVLQLELPQEAKCHLDISKLLCAGTSSFYNNPALSDITLVCPDGRQLHCHQILLAAASKRIASVLKQAASDTSSKKLPVQGVDSDALETLVQSWYTGAVPLTLTAAPALYDASLKLEVTSLLGPIEQFFSTALQPHSCLSTLERCIRFGVTQLVDICSDYIKARAGDIVLSMDFKRCRPDIALFVCKELAAKQSQVMAVQAAVSWLTHQPTSRAAVAPVLAEAVGVTAEALQGIVASSAAASGESAPCVVDVLRASPGSSEDNMTTVSGPVLGSRAGVTAGSSTPGLQTLSLDAGAAASANGPGGMQMLHMPQLPLGAQLVLVPGPNGQPTLQVMEDSSSKGNGGAPLPRGALQQLLTPQQQSQQAQPQQQQLHLNGPVLNPAANLLRLQHQHLQQQRADAFLQQQQQQQQAALHAAAARQQQQQQHGAGLPPRAASAAAALLAGANGRLGQQGLNGTYAKPDLGGPHADQLMMPLPASSMLLNGGAAAMGHQRADMAGDAGAHSAGGRGPSNSGSAGSDSEGRGLRSGGDTQGGTSRLTPGKRAAPGDMDYCPQQDDGGARTGPPPRKIPGGTPKGRCHVDGCNRDITGLRDYYQRYKICEYHLKVSSVMRDGVPQRFCQQCGRFQPLEDFDGDRRSCRVMLQKHCNRRQKTKELLVAALAAANAVVAAAASKQGGVATGSADPDDFADDDEGLAAAAASLKDMRGMPAGNGKAGDDSDHDRRANGSRAGASGPTTDGLAALRAASAMVAGRGGSAAPGTGMARAVRLESGVLSGNGSGRGSDEGSSRYSGGGGGGGVSPGGHHGAQYESEGTVGLGAKAATARQGSCTTSQQLQQQHATQQRVFSRYDASDPGASAAGMMQAAGHPPLGGLEQLAAVAAGALSDAADDGTNSGSGAGCSADAQRGASGGEAAANVMPPASASDMQIVGSASS